jgi:hypothetical protein
MFHQDVAERRYGQYRASGILHAPENRDATSGKTMGEGVCLFVNNSWWAMSNIKEVLLAWGRVPSACCRPHYLPREFSSILFIAVYSPPQN